MALPGPAPVTGPAPDGLPSELCDGGELPIAPAGGGAAAGDCMLFTALATSTICCCSLPTWLDISATDSRNAPKSVVSESILAPRSVTVFTTLLCWSLLVCCRLFCNTVTVVLALLAASKAC